MKAQHDNLGFWRGAATSFALAAPFWIAVGYGVYRLLKLLGY